MKSKILKKIKAQYKFIIAQLRKDELFSLNRF
jgi:hypothetical protein